MASHMSHPTISVRRHPFASPEGRRLIELLDANLASLYPDWDDLVHPGMHHENNPRPPPEQGTDSTEGQPTQLRNGPVRVAELKAANLSLEQEELFAGLAFFVAFKSSSSSSPSVSSAAAADSVVEEAIGCGALRLFDHSKPLPPQLDPNLKYAEVKRMYVHPSARGLGVSKLILAELEKHARDKLMMDVIVLETGLRQMPAVKLYETVGYARRAMFGEYMGADVESGGESICMEKKLR